MTNSLLKLLSVLFLTATSVTPALAADSDAVQGKWKADKERDGEKYTYNLQIEKDNFRFQLKQSDGSTRFVAKGKVKLEKLGKFKTLTLHDIEAGEYEDELQPVDDTRSYVYTTGWRKLIMAANFDKDRENEEPNVTEYRKVQD